MVHSMFETAPVVHTQRGYTSGDFALPSLSFTAQFSCVGRKLVEDSGVCCWALKQTSAHSAGNGGFWDAAQCLDELQQGGYYQQDGSETCQLPSALQVCRVSCCDVVGQGCALAGLILLAKL